MTERAPRVTVLMSVHNGGRWLRSSIESILAQTWRDFEFLIIDDASTDESAQVIARFADSRIRLVRLAENIGLTKSLNVGLKAARGELVARQDCDDLSTPDRLAKQVEFLDKNGAVAVVGAQGRLIDALGRSRGGRRLPLEAASIRWLSLFDNPVIHSAALFRTAIVRDEFGGYDESFPTCQDYDLWTRISTRHEIRNLPNFLVAIREHASSISATRREAGLAMVARIVNRLAAESGLVLTKAEISAAVAFRRNLTDPERSSFDQLFGKWRFSERNAGMDLNRTKARVFARVSYNFLGTSRLHAIYYLARAIRTNPSIAVELPWLRMMALFFFGYRARRWAGRG